MRDPNSPTPVGDVILPASLAKGLSINHLILLLHWLSSGAEE